MIEGVKESLREEYIKPVQVSRLRGRIHRKEEVKNIRGRGRKAGMY